MWLIELFSKPHAGSSGDILIMIPVNCQHQTFSKGMTQKIEEKLHCPEQ
jgi:hypothetical protein